MDLNEIRVFVRVVQAGSFNKAAKLLGIPNSTASAKVSALERRLGVTLLQRTTRKLHLTQTGETYFSSCLRSLDELQNAEAAISATRLEAQGNLRVTAPVDFGSTCLVGLISRFKEKYPLVNLEFVFTDQFVDLVAQGVDLAIRAGELRDSGLIAKRLGFACWVPFASPEYLKRAGTPAHPREFARHACLMFTPFGEDRWQLTNSSATIKVPIKRQLGANDVNLMKALALAGQGIALLPTFTCHAEIKAGKLVRLLPQWRAYNDPIHLLYPDQKFVAPKARAFIEMALEDFKLILRE